MGRVRGGGRDWERVRLEDGQGVRGRSDGDQVKVRGMSNLKTFLTRA